jgi:lipoprotein-anchoring transpeptidase ErfK/SrfK
LNHSIRTSRLFAASFLILVAGSVAVAQPPRPGQMPRPPGQPSQQPAQPFQQPGQPRQQPVMRATPAPRAPMKKASELISRQAPISINNSVYERLTQAESRVVVNLTKQRAYLLAGDEVAIDTPISSGKRAGMTPTGSFNISEKDKDHRSNIYGDFKDKNGRTVRAGVSVRIDSAPSGTRFVGAPMLWFMRLTGDGVGMHVGILPGYPASHGCIRMPPQAAEMFFNKVKLGTNVQVVRD